MFLVRRGEDGWGGWLAQGLTRTFGCHVTHVARIQESPAPQLERQHRPQLQIQVTAARVQLEQVFDRSRVEDAALAAGA